ncbi:Conserved_hypothetical protein [Hexamita inflata]|uniref:Uncharacterized protein n=1 Tax=Hexamita inflata TaxID=28002 RepID=A0AA86RLB7_9EUKA|nr:Conserved hypothetical protein [Hexamita inflata]
MIIYYEGSNNNEFLYTDFQYFNELQLIDKEEYDFQPSVSFVVPGTLLDNTKIIMRTKYEAIDDLGQLVIKDTGDYIVQLPNEYGTRQTEMIYLTEIAELIQVQLCQKVNKDYMVQAGTEWLLKHLQARFRITGLQTTIKFPEESYWLAKLLGAKTFKSNKFTAGQIYRDGKLINVDDEGNELEANGLIKQLYNKTMYKTNSEQNVTFDYTMYINLIKTVHVTCYYISKQTVLAKYKQYIILKHTLDVTPLARVKVTSDLICTISRDQLFKGLQICFCDEDFHEIPMDINTFYELELNISKSRKRAQLEIDLKTISEGERQRKARQEQDEMFRAQQWALEEFKLNYQNNFEQYKQNNQIVEQYQNTMDINKQSIEEKELKLEAKHITLKDQKQDKIALQKYKEFYDEQLDKLNQEKSYENQLYNQSTNFNLQQHDQMKAAKELSQFYKEQMFGNPKYVYQKNFERIIGVQSRILMILDGKNGTYDEDQIIGADNIAERNRVNSIQSTNLKPLAQTAFQELIIKRNALIQAMNDGLIDQKTANEQYDVSRKMYNDKLNRYQTEVEKLKDEYNEDAATDEAYKAYQMNLKYNQRKALNPQAQIRQVEGELSNEMYQKALQAINQKYHNNKGQEATITSSKEFINSLQNKIQQSEQQKFEQEQAKFRQQQEQQRQEQYINTLLGYLNPPELEAYNRQGQEYKNQELTRLHNMHQDFMQQQHYVHPDELEQ